jgi:hypothetical protein
MDDGNPVLDVELIVEDLHGPHAFGVTTEDGHHYLVVDKRFPKNDPLARTTAFGAYQRMIRGGTAAA